MTCDWNTANAVDTFFKEPLDCVTFVVDTLEAVLEKAHQLEPDIWRGYRNPVAKQAGVWSPTERIICVTEGELEDEFEELAELATKLNNEENA